jgi:succinoglycan biosynthesis protein ExoM
MGLQPTSVVIGVCTCKRPRMLRACLDSLAEQVLPIGVDLRIVVVDNDEQPNSRAIVEGFAESCRFPVDYVHEPVRGIARARNAVLDKASQLGADWIAMLDDDETADRRWIADLMVEEYRHIPVLVGRRIWLYPEPRPFWTPDKEPKLAKEGAPARHPTTGNVRFSKALIETGMRFDETLGLGGGEDQRFFKDAAQAGFATHATNRALTYEAVHIERMTYRFMVARHYAHAASLVSHRIREKGSTAIMGEMPKLLAAIPLGIVELLISLLAVCFGASRFKQFALRGGKRLAGAAGTAAVSIGHLPQPYRNVVGN